MSKKLYILTGWGERLTDKNYQSLISACPEFEVTPLKLTTRNPKFSLGIKPINKILSSLKKQIKKPHTIVGFSNGALLAFLIAEQVKPKHLILCSLPPLLGSDIKNLPKKELGDLTNQQIQELKFYSYRPATFKTSVFYGEKETDLLKKRNKQLGGIKIPNAGHKLESNYLESVIKKIKG